jgi:hypothetical protein
MSARVRAHLRNNVVGYVALFLTLTMGTAWAIQNNSVRSRHIVNEEVRNQDLAPDAVTGTEVADDSLGAADLGPDAIGFSELDAGAFNADIAEQGAAFGIPNDAIQGFEVEDDTLSGDDVDESTLEVVEGQGDAACCWLRSEILLTGDPYSADDPNTFTNLSSYELRSTDAGDAGSIRICNVFGVNLGQLDVVYIGGPNASTSETRSRTTLPQSGACRTVDVNGAQTDGAGDFRMYLAENGNSEAMLVFGASLAAQGRFTIFAITSPGLGPT